MIKTITLLTVTLIAIFAFSTTAAANIGSTYPTPPVVDTPTAFASIGEIDAFNSASNFMPDLLSTSMEAVDYFGIKPDLEPAYTDPCSPYYGRGYCVDLIQLRAGRRPTGNPRNWPGNVPLNQGKVGDALIFDSPGPTGHTGRVTRHVYQYGTANLIAYDIEEWNFGPIWVNKPCSVTNKFGITTTRRVPVSAVSRIWRP